MNQTAEKIQEHLNTFIGSENLFYTLTNNKIGYTDGVKYMVETCKANWLLDDILESCTDIMLKEDFICIELSKDKNVTECTINYTDGNKNLLKKAHYTFTDFPLYNTKIIRANGKEVEEIALRLFCANGVLYLPSEH